MESQHLHIGEVAERTGLSQRSLRYYEEIGLAVPSDRTDSGYRLYTEADVERIRFLMRFKPLGFSLEETGEVMTAYDAGDRARLAAYEQGVRERIAELRSKIAEAEALADQLAERRA